MEELNKDRIAETFDKIIQNIGEITKIFDQISDDMIKFKELIESPEIQILMKEGEK